MSRPTSPSNTQQSHDSQPLPQQLTSAQSDLPDLPPPPDPSSDPKLAVVSKSDSDDTSSGSEDDLFQLSPREALRLLGLGIEALVQVTGDIPPTPPPTSPTIPNMRGMQEEKENIVRSHSEKSLARLQRQAEAAAAATAGTITTPAAPSPKRPAAVSQLSTTTTHSSSSGSSSSATPQLIDGVHLRQTQTPTPPPPISRTPPEPYIIIGANSQPINQQHSAITRKFYSKKPPPISIGDYLARMHRFCPMSTAVYLATSLYIHRLAVDERAIPVTRRNAHRLLLAGLRVAMKALEDLSYPHAKMAKVGGVSELELARLEISFCFLAGFELVTGEEALRRHWLVLRQGKTWSVLQPQKPGGLVLRLEGRLASRPAAAKDQGT